jgi:voltage-gated potassium channel
MYFAFTSLSTVGFGDYYPVSDLERLISSIILLIGVAMFSYILGNLMA